MDLTRVGGGLYPLDQPPDTASGHVYATTLHEYEGLESSESIAQMCGLKTVHAKYTQARSRHDEELT